MVLQGDKSKAEYGPANGSDYRSSPEYKKWLKNQS
jgi:hypothetical protein